MLVPCSQPPVELSVGLEGVSVGEHLASHWTGSELAFSKDCPLIQSPAVRYSVLMLSRRNCLGRGRGEAVVRPWCDV
jgi:hypothetical protein